MTIEREVSDVLFAGFHVQAAEAVENLEAKIDTAVTREQWIKLIFEQVREFSALSWRQGIIYGTCRRANLCADRSHNIAEVVKL